MNGSPETPLRAFIVDDERLARENLRDLLREHPRIRVVGEARNVDEARRGIDEGRPDLLFLDIQMPGGSGFDLIESLDAPPLTIFVTAYDQFAIRAFEVNALDYLL
ncbi:MAG TPA: response regulator, partial [Syntrophales bacterium]|nr:response regulator [Syntrophales bacterium]